jgi:hypothetical protein
MVEADTRPWWTQDACEIDRVARHPDDPVELPGLALALANSMATSGGGTSGRAAARRSGGAGGASTRASVVNLVSDDEEEEDVKPLISRRGYGGGH